MVIEPMRRLRYHLSGKSVRLYVHAYVLCALVNLDLRAEATSQQLWQCTFVYPRGFDPPNILRSLYGAPFMGETEGSGSMLVLGNHNSGTSMLTRLIMLMGAFQGNLASARLHQ